MTRDLAIGTLLMAVWRGNGHDNAVVESFFQLLKRERTRRQIHLMHHLL